MRALTATALLAACAPAPGTDPDATARCAGAPVLGRADAFGQDVLDVAWTEGEGVWVGEPVRAVVPDDVAGLALTLDAGGPAVGFATVTLDGRVVLDAVEGRDFGGPAGPPTTRVAVTAETADTAWHTGDTAFAEIPGASSFGLPPFFHYPAPVGTLALPLNDGTRPWPGCLEVVPIALDDPGGADLVVATKRSPPEASRLDVDVVVLDGVDVSEAELATAFAVVRTIYQDGAAVRLGAVERWSQPADGGPDVDFEGPRARALRATRLPGANPWAVRVFLVRRISRSGGTLGYAAGIPGPVGAPDTSGSGVIVAVESHLTEGGVLDARELGSTIAHEGGHHLGLFHTTESSGRSFDVIGDTPECPRSRDADASGDVDADECAPIDGRNFMFWTAGSTLQTAVSAEQARVLARSPSAVREDE